jgi:hypothetical protein
MGLIWFIYNWSPSNYKPSRPLQQFQAEIGYAPYKFSVHKGWELPKKRYSTPVYVRKISEDLPESNFNLQVQTLKKITGTSDISLDQYVQEFLLKGMKNNLDALIISVKNFEVDGIPARDIIDRQVITINNVTREVLGRTIVFIIDGYVYTFALGTFEKDYEIASREFELMVKSFHFLEENSEKSENMQKD